MKLIIKPTAFLLLSLLVISFANGQRLNSNDLDKINNSLDEDNVSKLLLEKGFKFQSKQHDDKTNATELRYYFQTHENSGERPTFSLIKLSDSKQLSTTLFFIHNVQYYKEFIEDLKKNKYKFEGIRIVENKNYFLFKRNKMTFLTRETKHVNGDVMFEIVAEAI